LGPEGEKMGPTTVSVVAGFAPACRTTEPHAAAMAKLASAVRRETMCGDDIRLV